MKIVDRNSIRVHVIIGNFLGVIPVCFGMENKRWIFNSFICVLNTFFQTTTIMLMRNVTTSSKNIFKTDSEAVLNITSIWMASCYAQAFVFALVWRRREWSDFWQSITILEASFKKVKRNTAFHDLSFTILPKNNAPNIAYAIISSIHAPYAVSLVWVLNRFFRRRYDAMKIWIESTSGEYSAKKNLKNRSKKIKFMYIVLYKAIRQLNAIFGTLFLILFLHTSAEIIFLCNDVFKLVELRRLGGTNYFHLIYYIMRGVIQCMYTLLIILSCDRVEKSAKKLLDSSHRLQASLEDGNSRKELIHLSEFIEELLPEFSAMGFFKINQRLVPAFLSAMTSYIIITIQFEIK